MGNEIQRERQRVNRLLSQREHWQQRQREEQRQLVRARRRVVTLEKALQILQEAAQQVEQEVHSKIALVVTRCLETVFDDAAYEFQIHFEKKRGQTEARFVFLKDGNEVDPRSECGGAIDVSAFALRLAAILLMKPPVRRLLVLDEPFRYLSRENQPRMGQLLEQLAEEMQVQVLLVTHSPALEVGQVVRL